MDIIRKLSLALIVLLCFQTAAFCKTSSKRQKRPTSPPKTQPQPSQATGVSHVGKTRFAVSGPLTLINGDIFWGLYFDVLQEVSPDLLIGGGTGFQYWSTSYQNGSANEWVIPVLVTGIHRLHLASAPSFIPFAGLSLGAGIVHASISSGGAGTATSSSSGTELKLEVLAHAGTLFGRGKNLLADIKLGLIGSAFTFAPTFGITF